MRVHALALFGKNPFILIEQDGRESPSTKAWISDIPISCDEADIESALVRLGCVLRSSLIFERIRNKDSKLTRFLTGRHFIFIDVPSKPLERSLSFGGFTARLYHKEQPKKEKGSIICSRCLQTGHWASDCQNDIACLDCRKSGYKRGDPARSAVTMLPESVWDPYSGDTASGNSGLFRGSCDVVAWEPLSDVAAACDDDDTRMMMSGKTPTQRSP